MFDDDLLAMFDDAYEELPQASLSGDVVRTCARCGWTLLKEVNRDVMEMCPRQLSATRGGPAHAISRQMYLSTSEPGGCASVLPATRLDPADSRSSLFRALKDLDGLTVELWPYCDAYDIGVTFPSGEKWAIDCKDARDPAWLASHLNQSQFSTLGSWDQAYFIFPAHRRRTRRGYGRTFSSMWQPYPADVKWGYDDEFLKGVRAHLEQMQ